MVFGRVRRQPLVDNYNTSSVPFASSCGPRAQVGLLLCATHRMLSGLARSRPLSRVDIQQELDELLRLGRRLCSQGPQDPCQQRRWLDLGLDARRTLPVALMELYPAANRLVHELVGVVAPEGRVAAQKDIGDDAKGRVEEKSV